MMTFWQLVTANAKDIVRDRMSLFWFLIFPVLFILLFGTIFSGGGTPSYDVGIACSTDGPLARAISAGLRAVPAFKVHTGTEVEELAALKKGGRSVVIKVPESLPTAALVGAAPGGAAKIYVYYDKTQQVTSQVLLPVVRQVLDEIERGITGAPRIFDVVDQPVQHARLKDIDYLLPGILAMALMQLGLFGSLRAVSLREQKILKSLGATPLPRSLLLAAEVVVRMIMALVQTCAIVVIGHLVFDVNIIGSWLEVFGIVLLGAVTFVSMGYMLVSFAKTEESGQGIIQVVQFPMMFLSGIFFPIDFMPSFLRSIINAMPLTYLGDLLRQVMVGAPPAFSIYTDLLVLACWAVATLILAVKFWRWE
ncbi:MAG TPA: ABC transporter permease [Firmicutes bacterium]|nr:ABC transporter permease [Bacillota bacterium]